MNTNTYYKILAKHSGKCLDVLGKSQSDFAPIVQHDFRNSDNQQWQLVPGTDGYYRIIARHSNKFLNAIGGDKGDALIQFEHRDWDAQKWQLLPDKDGHYFIVNKSSGLYLTVPAQYQGNCVVIIQYEQTGGDNQKWQFVDLSKAEASIETSVKGPAKKIKCEQCSRPIEVSGEAKRRVEELSNIHTWPEVEEVGNIGIATFTKRSIICTSCADTYLK